jgi:UDP-3-O-[3-hydroxymyristoyl] glucosamine N-acyltransferase
MKFRPLRNRLYWKRKLIEPREKFWKLTEWSPMDWLKQFNEEKPMLAKIRQWYWRRQWKRRRVTLCEGAYSNSPFLWNCWIGEDTRISPNAYIRGEGRDAYGTPFKKRIIIEEGCHIGYGAFIKPGTHIGTRSIVGANSVVTRDIPPREVWAGAPAKKIKNRETNNKSNDRKKRKDLKTPR